MTIRTLLEDAAARAPGRAAVQFRAEGMIRSITYAALARRARQVAELAGTLEIRPRETPAALILENRPEWIEIYLGLTACGIAVVPVDPKLRAGEMASMLRDSGATAVFTDARRLAVLAGTLADLPALRHVVLVGGGDHAAADRAGRCCHDYGPAMAAAAAAAAAPEAFIERHVARPDDVASLIYTSGTTGHPKGALLTHANFCADAEGALAIISSVGAQDRFLVVLPLFHSFSFTANLIVPLRIAACMQLATSLRALGEDLRAFSPTVLMAVPLLVEKIHARIEEELRTSRLARLLSALGLRRLLARGIIRGLGGRLRLIVTGGAPCSRELLAGMRRLRLPVIEGYGLTEASPVVSLSRLDDARPGTIGYALPNIEVRIADPDAQGVGELQVRGPVVMRGYHNAPEATAEAFDGDWLRTGDLASMDADGYITIRGRRKSLIVNREGKNIYPEEVEECIARDPLILDVVVIGYRDAGDHGEKVGAIVTPDLEAFAAGRAVPPLWDEVERGVRQAVQSRCRDLADYKHPRKVEVRREPLERTSSQKVRRHLYQGQLDAR